MGQRKALVVGINSYSERWAPLSCCLNDASQVSGLLEMEEYGFQVTTLTDGEATRANILRWAAEARSSRPETLLFYFSGHGTVTDIGAFLVTIDNAEYDEGVEIQKVIRLLAGDQESTHDTLVFLDCCHSGAGIRSDGLTEMRRPLSNDDLRTAVNVDRGVAVIAASLSSQQAWEEQNFGHGIFTYYLLQALCGEAVDHQGYVTIHSLYEVVARNMSQRAGSSDRQKPVFGGHIPGRLVLAAGMAPSLPPPAPEQEYAEVEREAQNLIEEFLRFKTKFGSREWRDEGYDLACRRLESIYDWFERRAAMPGMANRVSFRRSRETLNRYRTELALVESGMIIKEGILERQLGSGGFGSVWQVRDPESGQSVAYKIYHAQEMDNPEKIHRFSTGYEAMTLLKHKGIVRVHRYSTCPIGFVMDFIEGQNIRDLKPHAFFEPIELIDLMINIAEAVSHAHQNNVIHRDIKPENIVCLLGPDGVYVPYLTDFDLAWFTTRTQNATKSALGVIYYAAPEQYSAFDPKVSTAKTPALDVFSFGQLLYFCFVGRDPDPVRLSGNLTELQRKFKPGLSGEVVRQIGALYKDSTDWTPANRIQSFDEILRRLWSVKEELIHTRSDKRLDRDSFVAELIYTLTNDPRRPAQPSFTSLTGSWEVSFSWGEKAFRQDVHPALMVQFNPNGRIGFENMANEKMRRILNERVDVALGPHRPYATRHKGKRGPFEVYVEYAPVVLARSGLEPVSLTIRSVLTALERA